MLKTSKVFLEIAEKALLHKNAEGDSIAREAIKQAEECNAAVRRFIQRVERGDPRLCKPGRENPKYFKKWGYDE